ncbi:hypothetical protein DPMN_040279 [Dreissena polymorpha]|uniref:Uncharacterized protein n=1 Tax=Dreissena polymorpha TaxID=45954 RepID=A0A9D4CWL0_DREPO|nr:hypothetical protein DPMN_040279 [Dreissena polymorpha]
MNDIHIQLLTKFGEDRIKFWRQTDRQTDRQSDSYIAPITNCNGVHGVYRGDRKNAPTMGIEPMTYQSLDFVTEIVIPARALDEITNQYLVSLGDNPYPPQSLGGHHIHYITAISLSDSAQTSYIVG